MDNITNELNPADGPSVAVQRIYCSVCLCWAVFFVVKSINMAHIRHMKAKRIPINVAQTKKEEIERWAKSEGLSTSAYFLSLHNDHVRYAYEHGLPIPDTNDFGPLAD